MPGGCFNELGLINRWWLGWCADGRSQVAGESGATAQIYSPSYQVRSNLLHHYLLLFPGPCGQTRAACFGWLVGRWVYTAWIDKRTGELTEVHLLLQHIYHYLTALQFSQDVPAWEAVALPSRYITGKHYSRKLDYPLLKRHTACLVEWFVCSAISPC
jgi:hypothetical protein